MYLTVFDMFPGEYIAYAKTEELKSQWIDAINHAKSEHVP